MNFLDVMEALDEYGSVLVGVDLDCSDRCTPIICAGHHDTRSQTDDAFRQQPLNGGKKWWPFVNECAGCIVCV